MIELWDCSYLNVSFKSVRYDFVVLVHYTNTFLLIHFFLLLIVSSCVVIEAIAVTQFWCFPVIAEMMEDSHFNPSYFWSPIPTVPGQVNPNKKTRLRSFFRSDFFFCL